MIDSDERDRTAAAIGWIAIEAARLEHVLAVLVVMMIGSARAENVVLGQSWTTNRDAARALLRERIVDASNNADEQFMAPLLEEVLRTLTQADQAMTDRNRVVHGVWSDEDASPWLTVSEARTIWRFRRAGRIESSSWSNAALVDVRARLHATRHALAGAIDLFDPDLPIS